MSDVTPSQLHRKHSGFRLTNPSISVYSFRIRTSVYSSVRLARKKSRTVNLTAFGHLEAYVPRPTYGRPSRRDFADSGSPSKVVVQRPNPACPPAPVRAGIYYRIPARSIIRPGPSAEGMCARAATFRASAARDGHRPSLVPFVPERETKLGDSNTEEPRFRRTADRLYKFWASPRNMGFGVCCANSSAGSMRVRTATAHNGPGL